MDFVKLHELTSKMGEKSCLDKIRLAPYHADSWRAAAKRHRATAEEELANAILAEEEATAWDEYAKMDIPDSEELDGS